MIAFLSVKCYVLSECQARRSIPRDRFFKKGVQNVGIMKKGVKVLHDISMNVQVVSIFLGIFFSQSKDQIIKGGEVFSFFDSVLVLAKENASKKLILEKIQVYAQSVCK